VTRGGKLERKDPHVVPGQALRPLRDYLIVKPLAWRPSAIIEIAGSKRKTLRGQVVAVGPGCLPNIHDGPKGYRRTYRESKRFQRTEVRVGDIVELGGLEIDGYDFTEVLLNNEVHVVCQEADVVGVHV
jgi:co-chaperonin GroES (HSP10)